MENDQTTSPVRALDKVLMAARALDAAETLDDEDAARVRVCNAIRDYDDTIERLAAVLGGTVDPQ